MPNIVKKIITIATVLTVSVFLVGPGVAQGITVEELEAQIADLLASLTTLQSQLAELKGEPMGITGVPAGFTFDQNLKQGTRVDPDVMYLQIVLNSDSATKLADSGPGSPGSETTFFGPITNAGVIKFQEKYASEVLAFWGLTSGTGFVGSTSRAKLNELLAGAPPVTPPPTPTAAGLTVSLDSDTPAAGSIADDANANFTKFTLTAGVEGDVSISKLSVTRTGLTSNSDLENIKIVNAATGVFVGSIGSLNVNSKALITFAPALVVKAGMSDSYYIRAGIVDDTTGGKTAAFGIASAADIVSDASVVDGAFPITGNLMTVVQIDIGSATLAEDGATVDSQPDVGDTDVVVLQFKVTAGSTEAITIEQITALETGSAGLDDTTNIELFSVTDNTSLGTVTNWSFDGKASWSNLGKVVDKGGVHRFKIMLDVIGGAGLKVNADLVDGSDVLIAVKGNTFGFFLTPKRSPTTYNGKGANDQSIQSGALTVSKSAATPATGNIAPADDQALTTFDFDVRGEEVRISSLKIAFDLTAGFVDGTDEGQITNIKVFDETGTIVAGPKDLDAANLTANSVTYEGTVTFTDTFIVPVGVHQYTVKVKFATDTSTGDALQVAIADADSDITAKGMTTNDSITASPTAAAVAGNTQTMAAGSLTATTLTSPVARNVAAGTQDFIWMTASLGAGTSGEDIQVTALVIEDTLGAAGHDASEIDNAEIWADLTTANSARGDIYETKVSKIEQPDDTGATDETHTFSLTQTVTVPKGTFVRIAFIADLASGASTNDTHTISLDTDSGDVTATGADTGQTITLTPSGAGQTMTVVAGGTLTLTVDSSSPEASLLIAGTLQQTLAVFRLAADNVEDLDLDNITLTVTGGNDVGTYYFYHGDTLIQTAETGTSPRVDFADGTVTILANGNVKITVKGDLKAATEITNGDTVRVAIAASGDVDTTGLASGSAVDSTVTNQDAKTHKVFESRPFFAVNSLSPAGNFVPAANSVVAIFDITADAAEDITFENADGNTLTVNISATIQTSDGAADTFTLIDKSTGVTLDTASAAIESATSVTFDFTNNSLTVPAGQKRSVEIQVDTAEMTSSTSSKDSIQLWLDDASATNVDWGIDGTGSFNEADIIFRGDIFGGVLTVT